MTTQFVIDCSVVMTWCFEDEYNPYSFNVLEMLEVSEGLVPHIWQLEVANVLLVAERRSRLTAADSSRFIRLLRTLSIQVDDIPMNNVLDDILSIGRQQGLSSYDAAYLELALRKGLPIATLDERLRQAASALGAELVC